MRVTETGRSRTSSYTSPKSFLPKQPQIFHNYKALSMEKLFQRTPANPQINTSNHNNPFALDSDRGLNQENFDENGDFTEKNQMTDDINSLLTPIHQNIQASKAYLNAMKALQIRNKNLEEEKKGLEMEKQQEREKCENQLKEMEAILKEKTIIFQNLEGNLKEKLLTLEENNSIFMNNNRMLEKEYNLLREEKERQHENINRQLRDTFGEKNELKGLLKMAEDKTQYLKKENEDLRQELQNTYNLKQENEGAVQNLQEKVNLLQEALKERTVDFEREREKIIEKMRNNEEYYEKLVEGELNEKQEIYRELNELKGEFEKLSGCYQDSQQNFREKEKENDVLKEKLDYLLKENDQLKSFSEYTQEVNEKLINNFINESISNINNTKQKTPENNNKYRKYTENNDYYEKKKQYREEYDATVEAVAEMEKELRSLIEKYRTMSMRIVIVVFLIKLFFLCAFRKWIKIPEKQHPDCKMKWQN